MNITFIQPAMGKVQGRSYVKSWMMEPLNIATLAGLTPQEHQINFYDDRVDDIPLFGHEIVAMPVETYTAKRTYELAAQLRETGALIILGGPQASLVPEEVSQHADITVIGEAEGNWHSILQDIEQGKTQRTYHARELPQHIPTAKPRRELFKDKGYVPVGLVESGRGCHHSCDFCAIAGMYHSRYAGKELDELVEEVSQTPHKMIYFVDDNFVANPQRTIEVSKAIAPLKKKWFSQGSILMANNTELLTAMERSGCTNILIGFESLNPATLKDMGKSWNTAQRELAHSIKIIRDHGITTYGTFVFGYDNDTLDDIPRTVEFAIENKIGLAAFNHLVPFPGTPLYERLLAQGRLINDPWWLAGNQRFGEVTYQPHNMSADELSQACYDARQSFYRFGSTIRRMWDFQANSKDLFNTTALWYTNLFSGKGVQERQKWPIGETISLQAYQERYHE